MTTFVVPCSKFWPKAQYRSRPFHTAARWQPPHPQQPPQPQPQQPPQQPPHGSQQPAQQAPQGSQQPPQQPPQAPQPQQPQPGPGSKPSSQTEDLDGLHLDSWQSLGTVDSHWAGPKIEVRVMAYHLVSTGSQTLGLHRKLPQHSHPCLLLSRALQWEIILFKRNIACKRRIVHCLNGGYPNLWKWAISTLAFQAR